MTTIAYKDGVLATDKQATDSGLMSKASYKAVRHEDWVFAGTGVVHVILRFFDWLKDTNGGDPNDEDMPKLKGSTVVTMNLKTGKVYAWEGKKPFPVPVEENYYAWGSGRELALGAMEMGGGPKDAIRVASKWDDGTGKGVQVFIVPKRGQ